MACVMNSLTIVARRTKASPGAGKKSAPKKPLRKVTTPKPQRKAAQKKVPAKKVTKRAPVKKAPKEPANPYPEWGASPYGADWAEVPWTNWADDKDEAEIAKIAERELIHGRWAMMGCAGSWAAENPNFMGDKALPWFQAGLVCTPSDCTTVNSAFPGQVVGLAPEGTGLPSFYAVLAFTVVAMGLSEGYRTGLIDPVFDELAVGDLHPGGEHFDPLNFAAKNDIEDLKIKEIKHARLAMFSFLGYIVQAFVTNKGEGLPSYQEGAVGPFGNWAAHVADPTGANLWTEIGLF